MNSVVNISKSNIGLLTESMIDSILKDAKPDTIGFAITVFISTDIEYGIIESVIIEECVPVYLDECLNEKNLQGVVTLRELIEQKNRLN